jgi:hypothetical protein
LTDHEKCGKQQQVFLKKYLYDNTKQEKKHGYRNYCSGRI